MSLKMAQNSSEKIKLLKKFGHKGHARSMKKGSKNKKKQKNVKFPKNTEIVIKFIASAMPFTICYLNEPFMS